MRTSLVAAALVVAAFICALTGPAVMAQTALQPISESNGVFTVSVPEGWTVLQLPLDHSSESVLGQDPGQSNLRAIMAAAAPGSDPQALVMIFAFDLPRPVSAIDWWLAAGTGFHSNFQDFHVVKEGIGKLGEREVYYNHFTWRAETDSSMYSVTFMLSEGTTGFLFMASTPNDPDHVQQYVPVFLEIAETLRSGR